MMPATASWMPSSTSLGSTSSLGKDNVASLPRLLDETEPRQCKLAKELQDFQELYVNFFMDDGLHSLYQTVRQEDLKVEVTDDARSLFLAFLQE
jgi:hypothetical protein